MQTSDNVLQLAKERALFGFAAIVQQALFDAEARIDQLMPDTRSGTEQYVLVAGRQFIQNAGKAFVKRVEEDYRALLDRAMETMYKEWRVSIDKISARPSPLRMAGSKGLLRVAPQARTFSAMLWR